MINNFLDINFPHVPECKKCTSPDNVAILKSGRWGIYCKTCGSFIKWATPEQKSIINARLAFIEKQTEMVGLKWGGGESNI